MRGHVNPQAHMFSYFSPEERESFFASLKKERVKKRIYKNRELATEDVSDYIKSFYNPIRRHRHLGGVSPEAFETSAKHA